MSNDISILQNRYRYYLDRSRTAAAPERFELDGMWPVDKLRDRVRDYFGKHADVAELEVIYLGQTVGFAKRAALSGPDQTLGLDWSDSQGATLPGEATGYRAVWFKCKKHKIWVPAAYYDARFPPSCPKAAKGVADPVEYAG